MEDLSFDKGVYQNKYDKLLFKIRNADQEDHFEDPKL